MPSAPTMVPSLGRSKVIAIVVTLAAAFAGTAGLTDQHHRHIDSGRDEAAEAANPTTLPLSGGSFLQVDRELPGPALDDGTPTKMYTLSLGRASHNHTASAQLTAAVDAKKLARREWQSRRSLFMSFEDTPLFPGWGTHFAYVYAGTPPQRVSVIIDTGSHFTAFPCSGCRDCGSHTDPHWDHTKSTSSRVVSCDKCHGSFRCQKTKRCAFSQRYSEGSSWSAFQVEDVLWVGELTLEESEKLNHDESAYSVEFMFGCIESQTGLFKTQLADGIMGMSADSHTLVWQLAKAGKIKERTFSLCFGLNGGTMVIGGYDPRLNKPGAVMEYTPSTKSSGWFTVKVLDITLNGISVASDPGVYQRGKGTIVDSGTTDTYLPKSVAKGFSEAWEAVTGSPYATCRDNRFCMTLTPSELEALPTLTILLDGGVKVNVLPEAYMDALGKDNAYAPRIYLTESMGGVLGANVMRDHNVVFDYDNHLVGFADGVCDYKADLADASPGGVGAEGGVGGQAVEAMAAVEESNVDCLMAKKRVQKCDANCLLGLPEPQTIKGHEVWEDVIIAHAKGSGKSCPDELGEETRECVKECPAGAVAPAGEQGKLGRGGKGKQQGPAIDVGVVLPEEEDSKEGTYCSIEQELWTPCSADCQQERYLDEACEKEGEARTCHVGDSCSTSKAGLLLSVGLMITIDVREVGVSGEHSSLWLTWVGSAIADAVAQLASIPAGNVEATTVCDDPRAADVAAIGGGAGESFVCNTQVEMHLTPKVDNVAAEKVSQVVNGTGGVPFSVSLSSVLQSTARRRWLLAGVAVTVTSSEKVSIYIASNREVYLPPDNNRLQSAKQPGLSGNGGDGTGFLPEGVTPMLTLAGLVVVVVAGLVFRVKHLRDPEEGNAGGVLESAEGYGRVSGSEHVEMRPRPPSVPGGGGARLHPARGYRGGYTSARRTVTAAASMDD